MAKKTKKTNKKVTKAPTKIVARTIQKHTRKVVAKGAAKPVVKSMKSAISNAKAAVKKVSKPMARPISNLNQPIKTKVRSTHMTHVPRVTSASSAAHRHAVRMARAPQFTYMNAPGLEDVFDVGNTVEVFCDHEQSSERVRGWIKGTVVQVDNKLVAVQFRSNVFLTDGWMVPDRILWYSLNSDQIRSATVGKKGSKRVLPDY
jgi:hypothetical protein